MPHHTPLIATIVAGLTLAFAFGALAHRLRLPPLVGYLLAGIVVGPFTPGYVADQELATELAEIGVILLMFGVGLHFSLKDLLAVRKIAVPGAVVQMAVATVLGMGLGHLLGWPPVAGFVFGLALSVASTVVLLKALQERRLLQTERGQIAVGWLIVEDLAMVLTLVILPALAGVLTNPGQGIVAGWLQPIGVTIAKVGAFIAFMLIVGRRVIPWLLHWTAHTGSRELFRLAVLSIALGVAFGAAALFGVSFALGAFFAGMILAESELSQQAAEDTLPLRDAFAVLFFVSVGMLFNPMVVIAEPWPLLATVAIIVVGKSLAAYAIVRAFGRNSSTALTISASLAQIGEFSFILASLGTSLALLPEQGRDLILAGAIISILLNPAIFAILGQVAHRRSAAPSLPEPANEPLPTTLSDHTILVGFGKVGAAVARGLEIAGHPFLVVELDGVAKQRAERAGFETLDGNAADPRVLTAAGIAQARRVIVCIPDGFEAGGVVQEARRCNPGLQILARAHSQAQVEHLDRLGADTVVLGEQELADAILNQIRVRETPAESGFGPGIPPPLEPGRPVLSDPEWALLAGIRDIGVGPGEAISKSSLSDRASQYAAFDAGRLNGAIGSLVEKGCLTELGDGRVLVTRTGYVAAANAPTV
jgi:CPA2 family monovalent cation:H+ antiporter-2